MSRDLQRAQSRANQQATGSGGRSISHLQNAFGRITEYCDAMQLPRAIAERAQHAYKIGDEARVGRGRNDVSLIAASILFATRDAGATRTFRELSRVTGVTKSELGRIFGSLRSAIAAVNAGSDVPKGLSSATQSAESNLGRFCNYLDLGNQVYNASKFIADKAVQKSAIDGRSPLSIAAGVLYFTCVLFGRPTTAKEVAGVAGVSESTIKLICKKVAEDLDVVIRPEWVSHRAVSAHRRKQTTRKVTLPCWPLADSQLVEQLGPLGPERPACQRLLHLPHLAPAPGLKPCVHAQ